MKKNIIIAIIILLILGLAAFYYIQYNENYSKESENEYLPEKEFYTKEDLKNIEPQPGTANIYYMWMKGCPVCAALDVWFQEMKQNYNIKVYKFDIAKESELFGEVLESYNVPKEKWGFVPFVFISDKYFIGFDQKISQEMENKIKECIDNANCINPCDKLSAHYAQ